MTICKMKARKVTILTETINSIVEAAPVRKNAQFKILQYVDESNKKGDEEMDIIKKANIIARQAGYGWATKIIEGNQDRVVSHVDYGYRKNTTGEYVPNAYRNNFGWKNTYYQAAETVVEVNVN